MLVELWADLKWDSDDLSEKLLALQSRIVAKLNSQKTSPTFDRIVVTGKGKNSDRCLTQTSIADGIAQAQLLGFIKQGNYYPGPIAHHNPEKFDTTLTKATDVIKKVLSLFSIGVPGNWELGDRPWGYLCTNIALRAIFLVMSDVCKHIAQTRHIDISTLSAEDTFSALNKYFDPLVEYFKNASADEIQSFRRIESSLDAVKRQSMGMNGIIHEKSPDYNPEGLQRYMENRNKEGTERSMLLISELQKRIFEHVKASLKDKFGPENDTWWIEGVPGSVRGNCVGRWSDKKQEGEPAMYLDLKDYINIANMNWDIFRESFTIGQEMKDAMKCLDWVRKINNIRQKTHHPEKGSVTPEEANYVKEIHGKVMSYFPEIGVENG